MSRMKLQEVFGLSERVQPASYVDRGNLDARFAYLLSASRHIGIHGDSKQGKSWLRRRLLDSGRTIQIQCLSSSTPEGLLEEALAQVGVRAELTITRRTTRGGQLELSGSADTHVPFAKLGAKAGVKRSRASDVTVQETVLGEHTANLEWVARELHESGRRLVLEDFHYLGEDHRRPMAELIKALGDHGLYFIVVGVWCDEGFLTYYNGDLEGRVEDVELRWSDEELEAVLQHGCRALNLEMEPPLRARLVNAAYGNVGLLQRLAERLCTEEGVFEASRGLQRIAIGVSYDRATLAVAASMRPRFRGFADNFVQGGSTRTKGGDVYGHLLRALLSFDDAEMLAGVAATALFRRIEELAPGAVRANNLTAALGRIGRLQEKAAIKPLVLTYSADIRRLSLADRALLFYRRFGNPVWPWDEPETEQMF